MLSVSLKVKLAATRLVHLRIIIQSAGENVKQIPFFRRCKAIVCFKTTESVGFNCQMVKSFVPQF